MGEGAELGAKLPRISSEKGVFPNTLVKSKTIIDNFSTLPIKTIIHTYIIVLIYKEKNIYFNLIRF